MLACNPLPTSFPALTLLTFWLTFCVIFYLTNTRLGFVRLGTIPGGFHMPDGSYEDIIVHYKQL